MRVSGDAVAAPGAAPAPAARPFRCREWSCRRKNELLDSTRGPNAAAAPPTDKAIGQRIRALVRPIVSKADGSKPMLDPGNPLHRALLRLESGLAMAEIASPVTTTTSSWRTQPIAASRAGYPLSTAPLWLLIRQRSGLGYNLTGSLGEGVGIDGRNPRHSALCEGPGVDSPLVGRRFLLHP